jgi:hydrogenase/urease accessory protein HupE
VLTVIILVFGLIALGFLYAIARRPQTTPMVLRIYVITIIVFGTLAIVAAGYSSEQVAPVMGLFGTIAGYILGRSERKETPDEPR